MGTINFKFDGKRPNGWIRIACSCGQIVFNRRTEGIEDMGLRCQKCQAEFDFKQDEGHWHIEIKKLERR